MVLDFINLALISMYVVNFRNPLLFRSMKKVFWAFPAEFDSTEKWKRLEPDVLKQHKWLQRPYRLDHAKFKYIDEEEKKKITSDPNYSQMLKFAY